MSYVIIVKHFLFHFPGSGILLFIFHANFMTEITARLCGPCSVHAVILNDKFQLPIFLVRLKAWQFLLCHYTYALFLFFKLKKKGWCIWPGLGCVHPNMMATHWRGVSEYAFVSGTLLVLLVIGRVMNEWVRYLIHQIREVIRIKMFLWNTT